MLRYFGNNIDDERNVIPFAGHANGVVNPGNMALGKLNFNCGTGHLNNMALGYTLCWHKTPND